MKSMLGQAALVVMTLFLLVVTASCNQSEIATQKATADKKAVGHWQLTEIISGWTGKTNLPAENVELLIDEQQQGILYEHGSEAFRFRFTLNENNSGMLRYSIVQQTGSSANFYPPAKGNFRVSTKQLIIGDIYVDGNDYRFERR